VNTDEKDIDFKSKWDKVWKAKLEKKEKKSVLLNFIVLINI
jgi:hypothetical protein